MPLEFDTSLFTSPTIIVVVGAAGAFTLATRSLFTWYTSSTRLLPGPEHHSWLYGSMRTMPDAAAVHLQQQWLRTYGSTIRFFGLLSQPMILTTDVTALRHILNNVHLYQKSPLVRRQLGEILGNGLLAVEGDAHKRQRRVVNSAFGPLQIRRFATLFMDKSNEMAGMWSELCAQSSRKDGFVSLNTFAWLNKVTLDIMGIAGFGYVIDSLHAPDDHPNELNETVRVIASAELDAATTIQLTIPALGSLPTARVRATRKANATIREIGMKLVDEKKAAVLAALGDDAHGLEKKDFVGNDLLSLLIRANMSSDMPEHARLTDEDILAQVPTVLVAGHETTSTSVAWTLLALATNQRVQIKLREEITALDTSNPSESELNGLTYLEWVVREAMRIHAPIFSSERVAMQDDIVPLKEPYIDKTGVVCHQICVRKGDIFSIPVSILNRSTEVWGEDAHEFRPERWDHIPDAVKEIPGVWSNMLTFMAGPHSCPGFRFSIVEMKTLLFAIVRAFELDMAVPAADIVPKTMIVTRPALMSNPEAGPQLPLLIRPVRV
ncbi:cytochrome P450 [Peniophora sp. CONT]|nr:cytochrome P450 [Peniophora sp. CONT]